MSTNDYDYDDSRRKAALALLGLSPTNMRPPSTPLALSSTSLSPGPLSGSAPSFLAGSSVAPRRRTPTTSSNISTITAASTSQTVGNGSGKGLEEEGYVGQPTSPVIPLKRKHPSNSNEFSQTASSQTQGRRRGAGSGSGRGTSSRGRGGRAASSSAAGAGVRHASTDSPLSAGPSTLTTRFDPVAHAGGRRSIDPDSAPRDVDALSMHAATPDRDQEMSTNAQNDHDADNNADSDADPDSADAIRCICGFTNDDGWSIGCDGCGRWCHGVCLGIDEKDKERLPERWECWVCDPSLVVDRERAVRLQKARLSAGKSGGDGDGNSRRRTSPGVERKPRKPSAGMGSVENGHKRRRRSSIIASPVDRLSALPSNHHHVDHPPHSGTTPPGGAPHSNGSVNQGLGEDTIVDIDEPWTHAYNDITHDIIPEKDTREKLRRQAAQWRGVTAISPVVDTQLPDPPPQPDYFQQQPYIATGQQYPPSSSPVTVRPLNQILDPNHPLPANLPPYLLRPPTYALLTTSPIPSSSLIAPFPSTITSSATYLADPLNAYAHLGMPKPYVHLIGPPLDVALDARVAGGKGRWARSGCRPNAVVRPVVCDAAQNKAKGKGKEDGKKHDGDNRPETQSDAQTLAFGIFALRDLKAHEEVVLGWEWDDGNVVHQLPALLQEENIFPPMNLHHFRLQMSNILHTLSSTFTICACGAHVRDCAVRRMAEFVERGDREEETKREQERREKEPADAERRKRPEKDTLHPPSPWTPGPGMPGTPFSATSTPRLPWDAFSVPPRPSSVPQATSIPTSTPTASTFTLPHERRRNNTESDKSSIASRREQGPVDLGPLVGASRGFKTRERVPGSGGLSGVEMVPSPQPESGPSSLRVDTRLDGARPNSSNGTQIPSFMVSPASPSPKHGRRVILQGHNGGQPLQFGEPTLPRLGYGLNKKRGNFWGDAKDKGKGKAVEFEEVEVDVVEDEDVDMDATDGTRKSSTSHPRARKTVARNRVKEKDKSQSLSPLSLPTSLHPPDPGTPSLDASAVVPEDKMPPKMRKRWIHKEAEALMASKDSAKKASKPEKEKEKTGTTKKKGLGISDDAKSTGDAMDVDQVISNDKARNDGSKLLQLTEECSNLRQGTSPSVPFSRLSIQSPDAPCTSNVPATSSPRLPPGEVSSGARSPPPAKKAAEAPPRPVTPPPPIRTSSSFLARVLNSPEHSWAPYWGKSSSSETSSSKETESTQVNGVSEGETTQTQPRDDGVAPAEAAITKDIKKETLEAMDSRSHSTDDEDAVMDEVEQDELLPTPISPSESSGATQNEVGEAPMDVDPEPRREAAASSSEASSRQASPAPVITLSVPRPKSARGHSPPPQVTADVEVTENSGTLERPSPAPETDATAGRPQPVSEEPLCESPPPAQEVAMSSPLSSPVSSPVEPAATPKTPPNDADTSVQESSAPTSADIVPELVPSISISPEQSAKDMPPATPPSVLSSLSPFSSPVSIDGHEDVKSRPQSPGQDTSNVQAANSVPIPPRPLSPEPEPEPVLEVTQVAAEPPNEAAEPDQEATTQPPFSEPSSNANTEPAQPSEEPQTAEPAPAPSKVKLSLKDFALRKRRMREEEEKERAEKAKTEAVAPAEEVSTSENGIEAVADGMVNDEVDNAKQGKEEDVMEVVKEETVKSPVLAKAKEPVVPVVETKPAEEPTITNPIVSLAPAMVNGDAKGRPHSPSLAPLPLNILSAIPALSLAPAVSKPSRSPAPDILIPSLSRKIPQQEEGEIDEVPNPPPSASLPRAHPSVPPKPPTPVKQHKLPDSSLPQNPAVHQLPQNPIKATPYRPNALKHGPDSVAEARSRTPPTQPRSFSGGYGVQYPARSPHTHTSPIPTTPRVLASVTSPSSNTSSVPNAVTATPLSSIGRPPPSGPRALRQQVTTGRVNHPPHSIPRGPSHERDRDTRDWPRYRR
ncbi:SET domain-containing protein 3 [Stygiomarasmius scandens]|uniref:SET domain-containing protein 3 n=1 Tax=Marasmiellus scandens TaxID=2682957 RepID=A0ABR1JQB6_9AGAR